MIGIHHLLALLGRDGNHADIVALLGHETILSEIETVVHFAVHVVIDLTVFTVKQLQPFGSLVATIVIKAAHPTHQRHFHIPLAHGNEDILALKSKKSDGIDISFNNIKLSKYRLVNNKDVTFTEAFEYDFKRLNELSVFQTHENIEVVDGKEIRREDRKLSVDIVKRIFNGESGRTLFKEYDNALNKEKKSALKSKGKKTTSTVTAPVSITTEDEDKIKKEVNEELEIALAAQEETEAYNKKPAIELFTNKATGFTEFRYTEYKPQFADENLVDKIYKILVEEGLKKPQIISICTKVAHLND